MSSALARKLDEIESRVIAAKPRNPVVYGIVAADNGRNAGHIRSWVLGKNGRYKKTTSKPDFYIPEKLERFLITPKRFKVVYGGRGSGKTEGICRISLGTAHDLGYSFGCFREYQNSIEESVYSDLKEHAPTLGADWFDTANNKITGSNFVFKFMGLARNVDSVKGMNKYHRFWYEEAQGLTNYSMDTAFKTLRKKGSEHWASLNPQSSEDPVSKRFIVPYANLAEDGIYEDEDHLIIKMNWRDNPWFYECELPADRESDYKTMSRALYDHYWEGEFNDSVDDALIMAEWFDACIDAHKKLGFKPQGARIAAHDPSDMGGDAKGFAVRHGSVVEMVEEKTTGNVNEGCDWATGLAINANVDWYTWDCDGMGAALNAQTHDAFKGKRIEAVMFKGSESPDRPDAIYQGESQSLAQQQKTNKDSFRNKRAQYYMELRERCYKTYRAVVHGEYADPDKLISFSSEMKLVHKLRAELCRIPVKPNSNGLLELYTKPTMKAKFNLPSPNLADSVMMLMRYTPNTQTEFRMPTPIRPMGRR